MIEIAETPVKVDQFEPVGGFPFAFAGRGRPAGMRNIPTRSIFTGACAGSNAP
jgi:hypothetical protein